MGQSDEPQALRSAATAAPKAAAKPASSAVHRYRAVRQATEALTRSLTPEDQLAQSMPDASPTKWHLAHTSWFFETFVLAAQPGGGRASDPRYRVLFNSYYEAVGEQWVRARRGQLSRPA